MALAPDQASDASTFLGAFTILLREGLEALLVVVAMIAFLRKADRPEALRLCPRRLGRGARRRRRDMGGRDLRDRHQRREPRADRGLRLAARGGRSCCSVGIWMHGKARPSEWQPLHPRQDAGRFVARLGAGSCSASPSSSSIARCSRRSCSTRRCGRRRTAGASSPGRCRRSPLLAIIALRCCASAGRCRSPNSSATARC